MLALGSGCKELGETFENTEEQSQQLNIKPPPEPEPEEYEEAPAEDPFGKDKSEADPLASLPDLPLGSPERQLRTEIVKKLRCEDKTCKSDAVHRIGKNKDFLLQGVAKLTTGQPKQVTVEAIRLAGLYAYKPALEAIGKLASGRDEAMQEEALWALGAIGDPAAVKYVDRAVSFGLPSRMKVKACRILAQLKVEEGLTTVEHLLKDELPDVRAACARALGKIKGKKALALLEALSESDKDARVQKALRKALEEHGSAAAKGVLKRLPPLSKR